LSSAPDEDVQGLIERLVRDAHAIKERERALLEAVERWYQWRGDGDLAPTEQELARLRASRDAETGQGGQFPGP
jgi:hypothetical protein